MICRLLTFIGIYSGYLSDGCVHDMAHLVPILGKFASVGAFATKRHSIHVCEDTLATTIKLESGAVGNANFTFVSCKFNFNEIDKKY